jgi:hypothetical protein
MSGTKALVQRLRCADGFMRCEIVESCADAADTVERLEHLNATLERDLAAAREALTMIKDCVTDDPGAAYAIARTAIIVCREGR